MNFYPYIYRFKIFKRLILLWPTFCFFIIGFSNSAIMGNSSFVHLHRYIYQWFNLFCLATEFLLFNIIAVFIFCIAFIYRLHLPIVTVKRWDPAANLVLTVIIYIFNLVTPTFTDFVGFSITFGVALRNLWNSEVSVIPKKNSCYVPKVLVDTQLFILLPNSAHDLGLTALQRMLVDKRTSWISYRQTCNKSKPEVCIFFFI